MPQVPPLVMPPAEASPEVAREDTHEGERRHSPVNALPFVELHVIREIRYNIGSFFYICFFLHLKFQSNKAK